MAKRWEQFSEEELKIFFEESKTTTEFANKIGYKDRHVVDDIKKKYSWCNFSERNNLLNKKFGRLTVIKKEGSVNQKILWTAQCDCGNIVEHLKTEVLKSGHTQSCGCLWEDRMHEQAGKTKEGESLEGKRFGKLLVLPEIKYLNDSPHCVCRCDCGQITYVTTNALISGNTQSCGCLLKEKINKINASKVIGKTFGALTVIEETQERKNRHIIYKCLCECGNYCYRTTQSLTEASSCGCKGNSLSTMFLEKLFKELNLKYIKEYSFEDLKGNSNLLRFDYAILNNNKELICLIEYQGEQHYKPVEFFGGQERYNLQILYDNKKREYCKANGIPLVEISFKEKSLLTKEYLLNKMGGFLIE